MYQRVSFHGAVNDRTGYGIHATNFLRELRRFIPVVINQEEHLEGDVHISLLDVVTASHTTKRWPAPSILYTVWESTEYPAAFLQNVRLYDQMWVVSEWERACAIAQGIPEEFVKVVHEGVNPDVYKPSDDGCPSVGGYFNFIHVGQWQPRKSTREICEAFLKAFPLKRFPDVRLHLSADTLFPSDTYKSTEERLEAYGLEDPRIKPVHFEERADYVRRLQSAHCFVSCSRSEGWGLPIIEAMSCGIPAIVADFGGSTEYAGENSGAVRVSVPELKKPHGIYGNWDVPGKWGEPDYNGLVEAMKDVYESYEGHKANALKDSERIRRDFSWAAAAQKAFQLIEELPYTVASSLATVPPIPQAAKDAEAEIVAFARARGYEIKTIEKRRAIFVIDAHPSSQDRLDVLIETIGQVKALGFPVMVVAHLPIPATVIESVDYYLYDRNDILSGDDKPVYWRKLPDGTTETTKASIPCHALAGLHNTRNAIDFLIARGGYEWVYHMNSDCEVYLDEWLKMVHASQKDIIAVHWDGEETTFGGQIVAGRIVALDKLYPHIETWNEFRKIFGDDRFCSERGFYKIAKEKIGLENIEFLNIALGNRFDQVDRDAWKDDIFECHFIDGPYLNIRGNSPKIYDVSFGNSVDGPHHYRLDQKCGMWSRPAKKYYRDWTVNVSLNGELKYQHKMNLEGMNVLISLGSKALGDTLAWVPYVEEFRKKHKCNVYLSTWWNNVLDYPEIHFITPGDVIPDVYATYDVGCFDDQPNKNPENWRTIPLQKVAADILGLEYVPLQTKIKHVTPAKAARPYVCFSEFSTMRAKLWNRPNAWQNIIDYLDGLGYDCVSISAEQSKLQRIIKHNGQSIEQTMSDVAGAAFYIGLNAGPTWIAHSLGIPAIMITGVSEPWNDYPNPYRVSIDTCRPGCFNDPAMPIDRGWEWCPRKRGYACTAEITEAMVIAKINELHFSRKEKSHAVETGKVGQGNIRKHRGNGKKRPPAEAGGRRGHEKRGQAQASA